MLPLPAGSTYLHWQAARLGTMLYEDMLEDTPDKADRIAYLEQAAPFMRL
jgi:hypothetical protein